MCLARWSCLRHVCGRAMFARKMVTPFTPRSPRTPAHVGVVCCALFLALFLLIYAKLWHFSIAFSLVLQDLLLLLLAVVLPLPRSVSPRLCTPRFASTIVRPEFALFAACLCKCVRSIQFSHICATLLSNVQHIATLIVVVLVLLCC